MKNVILHLGLFLLLSLPLVAQSKSDQALILQKCIDLPELQQDYPLASDGSVAQIYVLQHGVSFPLDTEVFKSGKPISFVEKSDINDQHIKNYFLFWTLNIVEDTAFVEFTYNDMVNKTKTKSVELTFGKENYNWNIVKTNIVRR